MSELRIGVVGYSATEFDEAKAKNKLEEMLLDIAESTTESVTIVSGLTALGVPKLAYQIADSHGWKTAGIACSKAEEFDCYPVDEREIVGSDWGDESETFLSSIDMLVRVGGGEQTKAETAEAKGRGIEIRETDIV